MTTITKVFRKKALFIIMMLTILNCIKSQSSDFEEDHTTLFKLNVGYLSPVDEYKNNSSGGVSGTMEIYYNLYKNFYLGVETGSSTILMKKEYLNDGKQDKYRDFIGLGKFQLKGLITSTGKNIKPYISAGIGTYSYDDDFSIFDFLYDDEEDNEFKNASDTEDNHIVAIGYSLELGIMYKNVYLATSYSYAGKRHGVNTTFLEFKIGLYGLD